MKYVIAGTGALGLALMDELHKSGAEILLLNHSGTLNEKLPAGVGLQACDLLDSNALSAICHDCDVLIHAAGVSGADPLSILPALLQSFMAAAEQTGTALLYLDTMDAYGDNMGIPISEASPERPCSPIEIMRSQLGHKLLAASEAGKLRMCIARCSDVYGPRVLKGPLGEAVFGPLIKGKPARMLGRLDMPHSFTFIRDMARAIAKLIDDEKTWGQIWHLPSPQPITQQQILDILRNMLQRPLKAQLTSSSLIGLKTVFHPELKAVRELLYRYEKPFIINHSRFSTTFGERVTNHEQALFESLEWFRRRAGIERRYGF